MQKKFLYGLSVIFFSFILFFIMVKINPFSITSYSTQAAAMVSNDHKKRLEKLYDVNFIMSKVPAGNMITYLPSIRFTAYEEAVKISQLFIEAESITENEDSYVFTNSDESVTVYKYESCIIYESEDGKFNTEKRLDKISDTSAIDICVGFITDKFENTEIIDFDIDFNYEEAEIVFDGNLYEIAFISRIANIKNYAFPIEATVTGDGAIIRLKYFYADYEKLSTTKIKSMEEAYLELPIDIDIDNSLPVDLKKCSLVYYYDSSIIQPAYMFEGEISGDKSFKCFINASLYNY